MMAINSRNRKVHSNYMCSLTSSIVIENASLIPYQLELYTDRLGNRLPLDLA